ncbi:MAG: hypothetical protein ACRD3V_19545 [Vicinamibacteria bacterium]
MSDDGERVLERTLHELAALIGMRTPWVFFAQDDVGALAVFSNLRPEQIRSLVKNYIKRRSRA